MHMIDLEIFSQTVKTCISAKVDNSCK